MPSPCCSSTPQLAGITTPDEFTDLDHVDQWLADQEIVYGKTLTVSTLADTAAAAQ